MRGLPPIELASTTAMPGTIDSASPTERNGSARIQELGSEVTATVDDRMLLAARFGVITTVSSCVIRDESLGGRLAGCCANAGEPQKASSVSSAVTQRGFRISW